ncbi:MAG: tetratricopeptide repeat protein [Nitrospirales bacterium]
MSIIADTLNRLQARSSPIQTTQSDTSQRPGLRHDESPTPWNMSMPSKNFLLITLGLATSIGSIGIGGFWIGWNLDLAPSSVSTAPLISEEGQPVSLKGSPIPTGTNQPVPQNNPSETASSSVNTIPSLIATAPSDSPAVPNQTDQAEEPQSPQDLSLPLPAPVKEPAISQSEQLFTKQKLKNSLQQQPADQPVVPPITSPVISALESNPPEQTEAETVAITDTRENESGPSQTPSSSSLEMENPIQVTSEDLTVTTELGTVMLREEKIVEEPFLSTQPLHTTPSFLSESDKRVPEPDSTPKVTQTRSASPILLENSMRQGRHLIRAGQYKEALAVLSTLFDSPPEDWEPWFWMGTAYLGKGDLEQADQYFLSGLARNDKVPQMWIQRALVAQQRGEYQLAIHELRQAESLQPDLPHLHLNMGYAYDQLGNKRLANQYYGKFMQLSEGNPDFFATRKKILDRYTQASPSKDP